MMHESNISAAAPEIGTPVYDNRVYSERSRGYVAAVEASGGNLFSLSGGMRRVAHNLTIVFAREGEEPMATTVPDSIAEPWLAAAAQMEMQPETPERVAELLAEAHRLENERREAHRRAAEKAEAEREAFRAKYRDKIPTWAKAVIVAEYEVDDCDSMTDYFNTKREKTVILGFSKHTRDLFPEMRKAAANYGPTAELAQEENTQEHREKYSMGRGYYLTGKGISAYSTGWRIRKLPFYAQGNDPANNLPFGEWAVPEEQPAEEPKARSTSSKPEGGEKVEAGAEEVNGWTLSQHVHTKKGFAMFIAAAPDRVSRGTFAAQLEAAKSRRGWYSRAWQGTPGGFAFKDHAAAVEFCNAVSASE